MYFIVDENSTIVYVGQATDLRARWLSHGLRNRVKNGNYTIRWMEVSVQELNSIEKAFINQYKPAWNKMPGVSSPRTGYLSLFIEEQSSEAINRLAIQRSTSRSAIIREAIDSFIKQQEDLTNDNHE